MSVVNQLTGTFAEPHFGPIPAVANGYLKFRLSQDCVVNSSTLVCAGYEIQINLGPTGNILLSPAQNIWPNDAMTPNATGYHVSAYTPNGQLVWGPNLVQVLSSPSPFNTDAWIPS
jgi:hypothetical protein